METGEELGLLEGLFDGKNVGLGEDVGLLEGFFDGENVG
jgi:hypothetical protein